MKSKKNFNIAKLYNPISANVGNLNQCLEMAQPCGNIKTAKQKRWQP